MPQPLAVTAFMASPGRFELPAPRLGGVCSIQLSYGDIFDFSWSRMERSASQDFDDLIIRRLVLYPTELLGHISKIFNFSAQTDSNELPLRRRSLYPAELQAHMKLWKNWRADALILYPNSPRLSTARGVFVPRFGRFFCKISCARYCSTV